MNRQVIKPQFDQPVVVKLDFGAEGMQRDGKYGVEYQYTLNDNTAVMWLPSQGRDALVRTQAQQGDYVQLSKTKRGQQNYWTAQVVPDALEDDDAPPPPRRLAAPPQPVAPQQQPAAGAAESSPMEDLLVRCFLCAGKALERSHAALAQRLPQLEAPIWEDIRATGLSLFIDRNRRENSR